MGWKRASFKDKDIWAQVDGSGAKVVQGGRTPIRYSKEAGAKVYRAGASRVEQVTENMKALDVLSSMDDAVMSRIDEVLA